MRAGSVRSTAATLTGAFLVATALGYGFLLVAAQAVNTADQYAIFLGLWGLIFGFGSATSVVEQEVARLTATTALSGSASLRPALRLTALAWAAQAAVLLMMTMSGILPRLTGGDWRVLATIVVAIAGFAPLFAVRGFLTGTRRFGAFAAVLIVEAASRLVMLGLLMALDLTEMTWLLAAVAIGSLAFIVPSGWSLTRHDFLRVESPPWSASARNLAVLGTAAGLTACLVTGFPTVATVLLGGSAGLGGFFAAVTASRLPLVALGPIQAVAVPEVVRLIASHGRDVLRRRLRQFVAGASFVVLAGAGFGAVLGPWLVPFLFGSRYAVSPHVMAALVASAVLIGATQLACSALLGAGHHVTIVVTWAVAVGLLAVSITALRAQPETRASLALLLAAAGGAATGFGFLWRETRPESPDHIT